MQFPLELRLRSSRAIIASVLVAHLAAALALFHVPAVLGALTAHEASALERTGALLVLLTVFASLLRALWSEFRKRGCMLCLHEDGLLEVLPATGEGGSVWRVAPDSVVVLGWAVWFRPVALDGAAPCCDGVVRVPAMMLLARNLHARDWRLLRIWLRHKAGRPVADAPVLA